MKDSRRTPDVLIMLVVLAGTFAVFASTVRAGFVYWDDSIVYDNPYIRSLDWPHIRWMFTDVQYLWRYMPLTWLGWAVTYSWFGLNPAAYHLGNLLFHGANAALVYLLLRKFFLNPAGPGPAAERRTYVMWCCGLGALLWAIHPLRVEPVAWVTDRVYGQSLFFLLLSLLCYGEAVRPAGRTNRKWYWYSVVAFAASLLSYQTGLGCVLVLVVLDAWPLKRFNQGKGWWRDATAQRLWLEKLPFAAVAGVVVVLALLARFQAGGDHEKPASLAEFGIVHRGMQAFYIWAYYFWKPWLPINLSPYYTTLVSFQPTAPRFVLSAVLVIALTALLVWQRRRHPLLWTLWLCHLILLVPVLGLTEHPHYPSDRYSFMVGITWSVLLTTGLLRLWEHPRLRRAGPAAVAALLVMLGALSYRQTDIWQNSVVLHEYMIKTLGDDPRRASLYYRLGNVYLLADDEQRAAESFSQALRINPRMPGTHEILAGIFYQQGKTAEAVVHFTQALQITPNDFYIRHNLGIALAAQRKFEEATVQFSEAIRLDPNHANARRNLARALTQLGKLEEAKVQELEAERIEARRRGGSR